MFDGIISSNLVWYEIFLLIVVGIIGFITILPIILIIFSWYRIKKAFSWLVKNLRDWAFDSEQQHTL